MTTPPQVAILKSMHTGDHLASPDRMRAYNRELFREVAPRYDFITRALSLGRDAAWKRALIESLPEVAAPMCVDLASGTGDIARMLAKRYPAGRVIGADLCSEMLDLATSRTPPGLAVEYRVMDMNNLAFDDASLDVVTGGYALRNAPDLPRLLQDVATKLKPGGVAAFLDFSKPTHRVGQVIEHALLKFWGGFWGLVLHRNPDVYGYIAESLDRYPDRSTLERMATGAGLTVMSSRPFYFGIMNLLVLRR